MGIALLILGGLALLVGGLLIVVAAFRVSVLWGLAALLIPFAAVVFVVLHWEETRAWLFLYLGGALVMALGFLFMPTSTDSFDFSESSSWEQADASAGSEEGGQGFETRGFETDGFETGGFESGSPGGSGDEYTPPTSGRDGSAGRRAPSKPVIHPSLVPRIPTRTRQSDLPPSRAGEVLGQLVEIVKVDGETFKGRIRRTTSRMLVVERPLGGGTVTFNLPKNEVKAIRVSTSQRY